MCGFPDKLVIASAGGCLVVLFGAEDLLDTFCGKLSAAYSDTTVLADAPIA